MRWKYVLKKKNDDKNRFLFNSIVVSNLKRGKDGASSSAGDRSESFSDLQLATLDTVFIEGQSATGSHCENHKSPKTRRETGWIGFFSFITIKDNS